jgi:hypothetical protein
MIYFLEKNRTTSDKALNVTVKPLKKAKNNAGIDAANANGTPIFSRSAALC